MNVMKYAALILMIVALAGPGSTVLAQGVSELDQLVSNGWENYRNGLYKEAVKDFSSALRQDGDNTSAAEGLGAAAYTLQDWPNAKRGYEAAHRLAPENCVYTKGLANVYMAMRLYDRAMLQYEKVSGLPGKPGCDPADNSAKTNLGYLYFRSSDRDAHQPKAIQVLNQVVNSADAEPGDLARAHYYLGMLYKSKKNYDLAAQNLEKTYELAPDKYQDGHYSLGQIYFNKKEYEKAVTELEAASEVKENDYNLHFMLGFSYKELGSRHEEDAVANLSKAANLLRLLDKTPGHLPHQILGEIYINRGDPRDAISICNEGLSVSDDPTDRAGMTCTKAKALGNIGQHEDAIDLLEAVIDNPTWGSYAVKEIKRQEELIRRKEAQAEN